MAKRRGYAATMLARQTQPLPMTRAFAVSRTPPSPRGVAAVESRASTRLGRASAAVEQRGEPAPSSRDRGSPVRHTSEANQFSGMQERSMRAEPADLRVDSGANAPAKRGPGRSLPARDGGEFESAFPPRRHARGRREDERVEHATETTGQTDARVDESRSRAEDAVFASTVMSDAAAATESTSLADSAAAAERAPRDRAVHSVIDMPLQLDVSQRSLVRREVEREARGRVAADPRAKSAAAQSIEVRVDHVTVRLDAPRTTPAPAPSAAAASVGGGAFGAFYFARSLR